MTRSLLACTLLLFVLTVPSAQGYAVLTHEAIIDSVWDRLTPILLKRFPAATPADLKEAHAYAYGGCILQDMGYYPFGSKYFSDLVHYVRSGDFVQILLRDAQDVNDYAFALGALAHYAADNTGHPVAVNRAVPLSYPELFRKYGKEVTYAENPQAHLKTEFGFDVLEVAQGNYAAQAYHDFIGFKVAKPLLERAFRDTYALELKDQFLSLDLALGTYRHTVSTIIPEATKVAWTLKEKELVHARPGLTKRRFLYNISRSDYRKDWGDDFRRPGPFAQFLAFLLRIVPKVGPFRSIAFRPPTQQTAAMFMDSFNKTVALYRTLLQDLAAGKLQLNNTDFDTGHPTRLGEYPLADNAYARLTRDLAKRDFKDLPPELRANVLEFYKDPSRLLAGPRKKKERQAQHDTALALQRLRAFDSPPQAGPPAASPLPAPLP